MLHSFIIAFPYFWVTHGMPISFASQSSKDTIHCICLTANKYFNNLSNGWKSQVASKGNRLQNIS